MQERERGRESEGEIPNCGRVNRMNETTKENIEQASRERSTDAMHRTKRRDQNEIKTIGFERVALHCALSTLSMERCVCGRIKLYDIFGITT